MTIVQRWSASDLGDPKSILIVLPTWVGDFVMATPFLRAVRERFKQAHVGYLAEPNLKDLINGEPWADEVLYWTPKGKRSILNRSYRQLVRELRCHRFDWAVLLSNSFRAALIARLAGAGRRIGYDRDGRGLLLTDRIPVRNRLNGKFEPLPLVEYYADLAEALGCIRPDDRLELHTTQADDLTVKRRLESLGIAIRQPLVVISPGAKYGAAKLWLPDRFAASADRLIEEQGAAVVITCGPGEESIVRNIASAMRNRGFALDSPLFSLGELKSLIRRCDLLLCVDAGPRHLAKAFSKPVVTVFGPTHPEWTATNYSFERIVRIDVDCGPCQQRVCPLGHHQCMTGVTVDAVYEAAKSLLAGRFPSVPVGLPHG